MLREDRAVEVYVGDGGRSQLPMASRFNIYSDLVYWFIGG